eukprot:CAMPEP_0116992838 /NCGR_PEP_ID=MMETSP0467-20121206/67057_1 /TAXON_ID=283647 /ORGANISM="Mesodinium pulex, Strain SPMC105" /LENGTH=42 /DNA_ID= /DNA_START= /DNA_END= /DNA_ORIENTATION=
MAPMQSSMSKTGALAALAGVATLSQTGAFVQQPSSSATAPLR